MTRKFVAVAFLVMVAGICFQVRGVVSNVPASSLRNSYLNGAGRSMEGSIAPAPRVVSLPDAPFLISQVTRISPRKQHRVILSWEPGVAATATSEDVVGYNVYRRTRRETPYTRINRDLVPDTNYVDDSVHAGEIYYYETTAVSSGGIESGRSKRIRIRVPYP
jgi:hypothetical protein